MEAFALGRQVISTYIAGIPEMVRPGENGWLVPSGDEVSLDRAISEAIELTVKRLAQMGAKGRAYVAEWHDSSIEARKLASLFATYTGLRA